MNQKQIKEFLGRLEGNEGCDFHKVNGEWRWWCTSQGDFCLSRSILLKMGISYREVNEFLEVCRGYGGYCDCEILLNAAGRLITIENNESTG